MKHQTVSGGVPPMTLQKVSTDYNVNLSTYEVITWPLYDRQTYTSGTTTSLTFFQTPNGQGGKTYGDTNMDTAGIIASPNFFFMTGLEVKVIPNLTSVKPSTFGAEVAGLYVNDKWLMTYSKNFVQLVIGAKKYITEPLSKMVETNRLDGFAAAADATTAGANLQTLVNFACNIGVPYEIVPFLLPPNQPFQLSLNWPAAVTLPSGANPDIEVTINGLLYRPAQ